MTGNLPPVGAEVKIEGEAAFTRAVGNVNSAIAKIGRNFQERAGSARQFGSALRDSGKLVEGFTHALARNAGVHPAVIAGFDKIAGSIGVTTIAALAGAAAIAAIGAAFLALGVRGANLPGLAQSFDLLTSAIQINSRTLLEDMRRAAAGTVSDFDLMRRANLALAGATGEFATKFAGALPRILEIARVQARATGQDVDFLFQSLVTGIKRSSPLLIDNTGLVLKVSAATEAYAQSIGKTAETLTAQERQIAVLNATLEAGGNAIERLGGIQETAAEKMARFSTTITNTLDTLAVTVQPVFGAILDVINSIAAAVNKAIQAFAPYIMALANVIARFISPLAGQIQKMVKRIDFQKMAEGFFIGGARTISALAAGIARGGVQVIRVVNEIAQQIADFLIGLSPPPVGPLSMIGVGGENTMLAWLEGFTGVQLDPVKEVARQVQEALGSIGAMRRGQIERRLAQLDAALKPFSDRLAIVKANFEAIQAPAEAALRAVDRQLNTAIQALVKGEVGSAELVRSLDTQREKILDALDAQQAMVDQAEIQFALAKAMQGPERALLGIRLSQLPALEAIAKAKKEAEKAGRAPVGGATVMPEVGAPEIGAAEAPGDVLGALGLDAKNITDIEKQLGHAIEAGGAPAAFMELQAAGAELGGTMKTLGKIDLGETFGRKFAALGPKIEEALNGAKKVVNIWLEARKLEFENWAGGIVDPARELSIPWFFNTLPTRLEEAFVPINETFQNWISSLTDPAVEGSIPYAIDGLVNPARQNSIPWFFEQVRSDLDIKLTQIKADFQGWVDSIVNPERAGSVPYFFATLPDAIGEALRNIGLIMWVSLAVPIINVINWVIDRINDFLNTLGGIGEGLEETLASIGVQFDAGNVASLPHISTAPPGWLAGAARGGVFGPGSLRVHRGEEVIQSARPMAVIPARLVNALDVISNVIAQPAPMAVAGGGVTNNSTNITNTFNGVNGAGDVMRRMAMARARR